MDIIIWGLTVAAIICVYGLIQRNRIKSVERHNQISAILPKGKAEIIMYLLVIITCGSTVYMLCNFYEMNNLFVLKRLILLALLWPAAVTDWKEYRIPNKLILLGIGIRILYLIPELYIGGRAVLSTVLLEVIAAVGSIVICLLCMLLSRGSLGMGDLKLMVLMSLYLGIEGICYAMFISLVVTFVISIFLLILKKKKHTDSIPFAPFILAGTYISFILTGV